MDENKNKQWRLKDATEHKKAYNGFKKCHVCSVIAFTDIKKCSNQTYITRTTSESDRTMYVLSKMYWHPHQILSNGQHGMADMATMETESSLCLSDRTPTQAEHTTMNTIVINEITE